MGFWNRLGKRIIKNEKQEKESDLGFWEGVGLGILLSWLFSWFFVAN